MLSLKRKYNKISKGYTYIKYVIRNKEIKEKSFFKLIIIFYLIYLILNPIIYIKIIFRVIFRYDLNIKL